jgi:hypothetical protein
MVKKLNIKDFIFIVTRQFQVAEIDVFNNLNMTGSSLLPSIMDYYKYEPRIHIRQRSHPSDLVHEFIVDGNIKQLKKHIDKNVASINFHRDETGLILFAVVRKKAA